MMVENKKEVKEGSSAINQNTALPAEQKGAEYSGSESKINEKRRGFLISSLQLGWAAFTATCIGGTIATFRYMYKNTNDTPPQVFKLGKVSEYLEGVVDERWKKDLRIWVINEGGIIYALKAVCTHLGCAPNWLVTENKFKCPCHGSGFRKSGINFEGPAPRPLERVKIFLTSDGQVAVDLTKVYRYELGQWNDPNSFIKL